MARFLLDTSVIIEFSKAREPSYSLVNAIMQSNDEIGTCAIVIAEFFSGIAPSDHDVWREFFEGLDHWPIEGSTSQRVGHYRYTFARGGIALALPDVLIAAVAANEGATPVTSNDGDFPMTGINLLIP
jgi:predicted nucleic acid-binding protein